MLDGNMLVPWYRYRKNTDKKKRTGKYESSKTDTKCFVYQVVNKKIDSPASNRRRRCLSGSSERPDRCQRSPLRNKDKIVLINILCACCTYVITCLMYVPAYLLPAART